MGRQQSGGSPASGDRLFLGLCSDWAIPASHRPRRPQHSQIAHTGRFREAPEYLPPFSRQVPDLLVAARFLESSPLTTGRKQDLAMGPCPERRLQRRTATRQAGSLCSGRHPCHETAARLSSASTTNAEQVSVPRAAQSRAFRKQDIASRYGGRFPSPLMIGKRMHTSIRRAGRRCQASVRLALLTGCTASDEPAPCKTFRGGQVFHGSWRESQHEPLGVTGQTELAYISAVPQFRAACRKQLTL